jgi:hypothetical protein
MMLQTNLWFVLRERKCILYLSLTIWIRTQGFEMSRVSNVMKFQKATQTLRDLLKFL